jgi:imidazolonepropionase-like amidohydrolase
MQTVISADRLFDGTGSPLVERGALLVEDGVIREVGTVDTLHRPGGPSEQVHFADCTLLPGLMDCHVHLTFSGSPRPLGELLSESPRALLLRALHNAQVALRAGITTVKDLGAADGLSLSLRDTIARGLVPGPRVLAAGAPITTTGGHCYWLGGEADTADDVRRMVRRLVRSGADVIKVMATGGRLTAGSNVSAAQYSVAELSALVEDAHRLGRKVSAHGHGTAGIRNAVLAGVDVIEHSPWVASWASDEVEYDVDVALEMVPRGTFLNPTLMPAEAHVGLDPSEMLPSYVESQRVRPMVLEAHRRTIAAGVEIVSGTDAGVGRVPFDSLPREILLLHEQLGLSPSAALRAATFNAARSAGRETEIGSLQPGRRADILAVEGDPLGDLRRLRRVRAVFKDGVLEVEGGRLVRC